jgi:GAF domain-containing protein
MPDPALERIFDRLSKDLSRDVLIQTTTDRLRVDLQVDRIVLYYFYCKWSGRVTFESLSNEKFSILGSTGPDECFNAEYAALYEAGRVRAIPDVEIETIQPCHRDLLRELQVRANLVVPILNQRGLWGLLAAHQCQDIHTWTVDEITVMKTAASKLAGSSSIQDS